MNTLREKAHKQKMALLNNGNEEIVVTLEWQKYRMTFFKGLNENKKQKTSVLRQEGKS